MTDADKAELEHLRRVVNQPHNDEFLRGVSIEAEHQLRRWGKAHDRDKSAENWFWLVGYLAGKALRAAITGDRDKALHHTISSAAALYHWHAAILADTSATGAAADPDLAPLAAEPAATPLETPRERRGMPIWLGLFLLMALTGGMFWCIGELPAMWAKAGAILCVAGIVALPHLPRQREGP